MNDNYGIPIDDLIRLMTHLRAARAAPHSLSSAELRLYLAGVAQGRAQAAKQIEELLVEYGTISNNEEESK